MNVDEFVNSKKGKIVALSVASVFLYAFLTLLIFGFKGGSSFWISFTFAIISFALSFFVYYLSINSAKKLTDWIFSLPIARWCVIYIVVEVIVATFFMLVETAWKVTFIPQFLIPVFFLILVVPCFAQKNHIANINTVTVAKVSYIRLMNAKLIALLPRTEDAALKKDIEKAADMLRHSDPMSADTLAELEQKMTAYVDQIDIFVRAGNYTAAAPLAKEICLLIEERNQLVIASKLRQY